MYKRNTKNKSLQIIGNSNLKMLFNDEAVQCAEPRLGSSFYVPADHPWDRKELDQYMDLEDNADWSTRLVDGTKQRLWTGLQSFKANETIKTMGNKLRNMTANGCSITVNQCMATRCKKSDHCTAVNEPNLGPSVGHTIIVAFGQPHCINITSRNDPNSLLRQTFTLQGGDIFVLSLEDQVNYNVTVTAMITELAWDDPRPICLVFRTTLIHEKKAAKKAVEIDLVSETKDTKTKSTIKRARAHDHNDNINTRTKAVKLETSI